MFCCPEATRCNRKLGISNPNLKVNYKNSQYSILKSYKKKLAWIKKNEYKNWSLTDQEFVDDRKKKVLKERNLQNSFFAIAYNLKFINLLP